MRHLKINELFSNVRWPLYIIVACWSCILAEDIVHSNAGMLISCSMSIQPPVESEKTTEYEKLIELKFALSKQESLSVMLYENTMPISTGWTKKFSIARNLCVDERSPAYLRTVVSMDHNQYYALRFKTSDGTRFFSKAYVYKRKGCLVRIDELGTKEQNIESDQMSKLAAFCRENWIKIVVVFLLILVGLAILAFCFNDRKESG